VAIVIEWGHGRRDEVSGANDLDARLDRIGSDALAEARPQDVQVSIEGAGTLGIVVGAEWSVLNHIPPDLDPPYRVSVGREDGDEPLAFYVAGDHHSEVLRRNTISPGDARAAMRHFVETGELSAQIDWEEI
jgi:hypothetical protein